MKKLWNLMLSTLLVALLGLSGSNVAFAQPIGSFLTIQGVFNPKSGTPDGDSVRFLADDVNLFTKLKGVGIKNNKEVQLRYEGIDTLERAAKQPFASDATNRNIALLGGNENGLPGYILSSQSDGNGRPVSFAFVGNPPNANGTTVSLDSDLLKQSVNYQLLADGFAYPMFYETLSKELRDEMTAAVKAARAANNGIWAEDASNTGVTINPPVDLAELPPIFPKLWRRLASNKTKTAQEVIDSIAKGSDRLFTTSDPNPIKFSTVLEATGNSLRLTLKPEDMIFLP